MEKFHGYGKDPWAWKTDTSMENFEQYVKVQKAWKSAP